MQSYLQSKDIDVLMEALDCYVSIDHMNMLNNVMIIGMFTKTEEESRKVLDRVKNYEKDRDKEEIVIMLKAKLLLLKQQMVEKGEAEWKKEKK